MERVEKIDIGWILNGRADTSDFVVGRFYPRGYQHLFQVRNPMLRPQSLPPAEEVETLPESEFDLGYDRIRWNALARNEAWINAKAATELANRTGAETVVAWIGVEEVTAIANAVGRDADVVQYWDEITEGRFGKDIAMRCSVCDWVDLVRSTNDGSALAPTYVWSEDRSWLLWTSQDLCYSILGMQSEVSAATLLSSEEVEVVEARLDFPV